MPIKVKDNDKCKEWERRRRDRLNDAFKSLAQLLPHYDPAKIPAKIDILEKSTEFVKELRLSNSRLLSTQAENDEKCKLIKELQDEVNKLILRVKQLTVLLKKAEITIPTGPAIKLLGSKRLKWSGKFKLKPSDIKRKVSDADNRKESRTLSPKKSSLIDSASENTSSLIQVSPTSETGNQKCVPTLKNVPASIIVPLKQPKSNGSNGESLLPFTTNTSPNKLPQPILTPIVAEPTPKPSNQLVTESIFNTTSALQLPLPLQTIILAPCPIAPTLPTQTPQIFTRFALPTQVLSKSLDGMALQKIAIRPVLKPIPKVIHRRKKRSKQPIILSEKNEIKNLDQAAKLEKDAEDKNEIASVLSPCKEALDTNIISNSTNGAAKDSQNVQEVDKEPSNSKSQDVTKLTILDNVAEIITKDSTKKSEGDKSTKITPENNTDKSKISEPPQIEISSQIIPVLRIIETSDATAIKNDTKSDISNRVEEQAIVPETVTESVDIEIVMEVLVTQPAEEAEEFANHVDTEECVHIETPVSIAEEKSKEPEPSCLTAIPRSPKIAAIEVGLSLAPLADKTKNAVCEVTNKSLVEPGLKETIKLVEVVAQVENQQISMEIEPNESIKDTLMSEKPVLLDKEKMESLPEKVTAAQDITVSIVHTSKSVNNEIVSSDSAITTTQLENMTQQSPSEKECIINGSQPTPTTNQPLIETRTILELPPTTTSRKSNSSTNSEKQVIFCGSEMMDTSENVTTDKISECIARSIDLIDANDSELMELSEHWDNAGGSPKSPISPTQMFLNIFPLLPRESSIAEPHQSHPHPPTTPALHLPQTTPQKAPLAFPSSSNRSSFFIDAMLPDDHSGNSHSHNSTNLHVEMDIITSTASSVHSQCLALTPPQFSTSSCQQATSSHMSNTNNYYWTPSSSCGIENTFDYRSNHTRHQSEITPTFTNESNKLPTTSIPASFSVAHSVHVTTVGSSSYPTLTPLSVPTSAPSIINPFVLTTTTSSSTTSSSVITPFASTLSSNFLTSSTKAPVVSTTRSKKATSIAKSMVDNLPTFYKSKISNTTPSTSISTSTTVTWSITAPTQSSSLQYIPNVHNPSTSTTHSTLSTSSSQSHSCSLLDSLNSMDASFFPSLINHALDGNDFRSLEYVQSVNSTLPPSPIIPPTKPMYGTHVQFNTSSIPQNPMTINYHTPVSTGQNQHTPSVQNTFVHHHTSLFPSNTTAAANLSANSLHCSQANNLEVSASKKQPANSNQSLHQLQISQPESSSKSARSQSSVERASKATVKQTKSEIRQSRSGKSSRTQPYILPNTCTQSGTSANPQVHSEPILNPNQTSQPTYHSDHSVSNINISKPSTNSGQNYDFHLFHSSNFDSGNQFHLYSSTHTQPQQQHQTQVLKQSEKTTPIITDTKSQKGKVDKTHVSHSKSKAYPSLTPLRPSEPQTSNNTLAPVFSVANTSTASTAQVASGLNSSTVPTQSHQTIGQQQPSKTTLSKSSLQPFQFHSTPPTEPFQFYPEFGGNGTRQFTGHHESISQNIYNQPSQPTSSSNFPLQRSHHPYYLSDITPTFENFPIHVPQSQSQHNSSQSSRTITTTCSTIQHPTSKYMYASGSTGSSTQQANGTGTIHSIKPQHQASQATSHSQRHQHSSSKTQQDNFSQSQTHAQQQTQQLTSHTQPQQMAPINQQHRVGQRQVQEPCQQSVPQMNPNQLPTASSATSVSSSKVKQQQPLVPTFHSNQSQIPQPHRLQQQQHVPSQPSQTINRPSSSRTVNWMTDTGYRTNNSTSGVSTNNKQQQRQAQSVSANNPFSVSKLVGNSVPSGKNPVPPKGVGLGDQPTPIQSNSSNNTGSNISRPAGTGSTTATYNSNNQSNYCAEALIRKNPEWNEFNLSTTGNPSFPPYGSQPPSSNNSEHFPTYPNFPGQYHYTPGANSSHFGHFDTQTQHFSGTHHLPGQSGNYQHPQNVHPQSQHGQIHYHPHASHQQHGTSTSSVSNFNLSTIFPEINDKRNSNNNVNQSGGSNLNSCNYHHTFNSNASGSTSGNLHR